MKSINFETTSESPLSNTCQSVLNIGYIEKFQENLIMPITQRASEQWKLSWKQDFIISFIVYGMKIPPIHMELVDGKYDIHDGQQRVNTLKSFVNDKFRVPFALPIGDGNLLLTYSNIKNIDEDNFSFLEDAEGVEDAKEAKIEYAKMKNMSFKEIEFVKNNCNKFLEKTHNTIPTVIYKNLTHKDRILLFEVLNHSVSLNDNQREGAVVPFSRKLISYLFEDKAPETYKFFASDIKSGAIDKFLKRILYSLTSGDLNKKRVTHYDKFKSSTNNNGNVKKFTEDIENMLISGKVLDFERLYNDEPEEFKSNLYKILHSNKLNFLLNKVIMFNSIFEKSKRIPDRNPLLCWVIYCNYLFDIKSLTEREIESDKFQKAIDCYINEIQIKRDQGKKEYNTRSDTTGHKVFKDEAESALKEQFTLKIRNIPFSEKQKKAIKKKGKCEVCSNENNLEVDHKIPTSEDNSNIPGLLCSNCNSWKADKNPYQVVFSGVNTKKWENYFKKDNINWNDWSN